MLKLFWNELFKEVPFPKGANRQRYAITNYGRLISFRENVDDGSFRKVRYVDGYPAITLRIFKKNTTFLMHKLVAEQFLPKPPAGQKFVIHLDYNKKNNQVSNLKWVAKEEMTQHQRKNPFVIAGREKRKMIPTYRGHKLTATQVRLMKKRIFDPNRKTRLKLIAKQFGISEMQLYRIKNGENWSHVKI